jgi:hypothetical protein
MSKHYEENIWISCKNLGRGDKSLKIEMVEW